MPGTYDLRRDEMRHFEWVTLFADRSGPQGIIRSFLSNLNGRYSRPEFPILQFYGVSGEGKTALFRRTEETLSPSHSNLRCAFVELEVLEGFRVRQAIEVLWHITDALAQSGVIAPLTMCLYAQYWRKQNAGQEFRLHNSPLKEYLQRCSEHCIRSLEVLTSSTPAADAAAQSLGGVFHELFDLGSAGAKSWTLIEKVWGAARDYTNRKQIAKLRGAQPGEWNIERIEASFPEFLSLDIFNHLRDNPDDKVCLVVDTFERLQPDSGGRDTCERSFQDLCARLIDVPSEELRGRSGILLFGREIIDWQRYDATNAKEPWSKYIQTIRLEGFSERDAKDFLRKDFREFWDKKGCPNVSVALKVNETTILTASEEHPRSGTTEAKFLPYFLRLSGELIYEQGEHFTPDMLGRTPDELQDRFLRFVRERSPEKVRALQTLALALYFDQALFQHLVREGQIQGIPTQSFLPALVGGRSYVEKFDSDGTVNYRFHRHMQQALLDDLGKDKSEVEAARGSINTILRFYAQLAKFSSLRVFAPQSHLPPYVHAMDILLTFAERGWIEAQEAMNWFRCLEAPFDRWTAPAMRASQAERALLIWVDGFGPKHPWVAIALTNLATLYLSQSKYVEAELLYRRALQIEEEALGLTLWKEVLGALNLEMATTLDGLGTTYLAQHKYQEAESLFRRAKEIQEKALSPVHPHLTMTVNNLAIALHGKGQKVEAATLLANLLGLQEKLLGLKHRHLAMTLANLASFYYDLENYVDGEPLARRAITIQKKVLGKNHPELATSLVDLGQTYLRQGEYRKAERPIKSALMIRKSTLGPGHPDTLLTLRDLAMVHSQLDNQKVAERLRKTMQDALVDALAGDPAVVAANLSNLMLALSEPQEHSGAESLGVRVLTFFEKTFGLETHLDLVPLLDHLARLDTDLEKYRDAEMLHLKVVDIVEASMKSEDPLLAQALNNLAGLYCRQGQYDKAEPIYERALAIFERAPGSDSGEAAAILHNLAMVYANQGKSKQAEDCMKRMFKAAEKASTK